MTECGSSIFYKFLLPSKAQKDIEPEKNKHSKDLGAMLEEVNLRPHEVKLRLQEVNLQPQEVNLRPQEVKLRPQEVNLRPLTTAEGLEHYNLISII